MKFNKNLLSLSLKLAGVAAIFVTGDAMAAGGYGDVAANVSEGFGSVGQLITGGAYLGGAGIGVQSALKFKEHNDNPQQTKLSKPITLAAVAGMLLALPSFFDTTTASLFAGGEEEGSTSNVILN